MSGGFSLSPVYSFKQKNLKKNKLDKATTIRQKKSDRSRTSSWKTQSQLKTHAKRNFRFIARFQKSENYIIYASKNDTLPKKSIK